VSWLVGIAIERSREAEETEMRTNRWLGGVCLAVAAAVIPAMLTGSGRAAGSATSGAQPVARQHPRAQNAAPSSAVGSWHVTVHVDGTPAPAPFDTLYLLTRDGGFLRIDGRNNAPGLGSWTESTQHRLTITVVLFSFDATGHRVGTITSNMLARVRDGVLGGTFNAAGVDLAGNNLPGFPKTGTFTGERITAQAP
jgi:hypothetical protein